MKPIRMIPSYRFGSMTPWGGDGLRRYYGREIPDPKTGESMEISTIPRLESRTSEGEPLTELVDRFGERLTGRGFSKPFPLLLKLLAARDRLSVQVHPDDEYARIHENKQGKTEAWVILHAEEGAQLLYGLKPGVTGAMLSRALHEGGDVENLIRKISVHEGDVFYMPSGMVHAIGGGIVLYEIQQASDVTYRLWDYNRTDGMGQKRPLHINQALDVIRPELTGYHTAFASRGDEGCFLLIDSPAFTLRGIRVKHSLDLPEGRDRFSILTALNPLLLVGEQGDKFPLAEGESLLLPAEREGYRLEGNGRGLLSEPGSMQG